MRMHVLPLFVVFLVASWPAMAEDGATAAPTAAAPARAASAATVLEDKLDVYVDGSRAKQTRTWKVRIDDPAACSAGLVVPDGLNGAQSDGARVYERLLAIPDGTAAGTVFTLVASVSRSGPAHSGTYTTAPDLPVEHAEVTVRSYAPYLSVWTDPEADADFVRGNGRTATITWTAVRPGDPAEAVWSTWRDWIQAGERAEASVAPMLATTREQLGRDIAADLRSLSVATAAERVFRLVAYEEGQKEDWSAAKRYDKVLDAKTGSAVDRGVVLISVLRLAGFDARPAMFRAGSTGGSLPLSIPAPALLDRPAVAVFMPDRVVWVDPASEHVAIPELPGSMQGGSVWVPGDIPYDLPSAGVVDGVVAVSAQTTVSGDGSATWTATISASGVGQESLRALLAPLDAKGREEALRRLVITARPDLDRFGVDASGIDDPYRPLKITLQGHEPAALGAFGTIGLTGTVQPLMAPALAAWLPSRLLIREDLAIAAPQGLHPISTAAAQPSHHADVTLSRRVHREGAKLVLVTEAERPYRTASPARDSAAEAFLRDAARVGPDVLLLPPPTPDVVKGLRVAAAGRPEAEIAVLEALLWWTYNDQPKKASKALQRATTETDPEEVAQYLRRHARKDDPRPWLGLFEVARTDQQKLVAIGGLEAQRQSHHAWIAAARLATTTLDPAVKVEALLVQERLQESSRPDERLDEEGWSLWREPDELLAEATQLATTLPGANADGDPRVLLRLAEKAMAEGRTADAELHLDRALAIRPDPIASVLLAQASAASGVAVSEVEQRIREAVQGASFDAEVLSVAAQALAGVGREDLALEYALSAARLAFDDADHWRQASMLALANGDLALSVYAARRASDLAPGATDAGAQLALLATLAKDKDAAMLGNGRAGGSAPNVSWPPTLEALMGIAPEHALHALLDHHDAEVIASAPALSLRAQLRLAAGDLDGAARDGVLLASRHDEPRGTGIAFAATAGRLWTNAGAYDLDAATRGDPFAAATRMEYRLVTGGDPTADARGLKGDPRADLILRAAAAPETVAEEVEGWPKGLADPQARTPRGFRTNRVLGAAKGVVAWSDPERGVAVMRAAQATGSLPPPLALLYTPASPPLARLEGGGQLVRLEGGAIPLYAAIRIEENGQEVTALGFTPSAAEAALKLAMP